MTKAQRKSPAKRSILAPAVYALMIAITIVGFLVIRHFGESLEMSTVAAGTATDVPVRSSSHALVHVLVALLAVVAIGRLLSPVFRHFRQPPVIGEVLGGIMLGPSLLGHVWPAASEFILPKDVAPYLGVIAQLGVILYMFVVGLELDDGSLRARGHATVAISHASIVAPFLLGALLALGMYQRFSSYEVSFTVFALFLGVSMSVTAFPVLARILTDRRMTKTDLGIIALACAAADDVTAWCLLALVVGVAQAEIGGAVMVAVLTLGFIATMFLVVRPALTRLVPRLGKGPVTQGTVALALAALLASALTTEWIGIHAIFGAFMLGAVVPHDSPLARELAHKLEDLVTVLLLPAFFAFTGMRTQVGLVSGWEHWLWCGLIIVVATVGKFGGTLAAARATGLDWRNGAALGILMNTRGLMELIVLNIGLDLKVISPTVFAMMLIMALVTTIATTPMLQLLLGSGHRVAVVPRLR